MWQYKNFNNIHENERKKCENNFSMSLKRSKPVHAVHILSKKSFLRNCFLANSTDVTASPFVWITGEFYNNTTKCKFKWLEHQFFISCAIKSFWFFFFRANVLDTTCRFVTRRAISLKINALREATFAKIFSLLLAIRLCKATSNFAAARLVAFLFFHFSCHFRFIKSWSESSCADLNCDSQSRFRAKPA